MNNYDKAYQRYCDAYDALHDQGIYHGGFGAIASEFRAALEALKAEEINFCPLDYKQRVGHSADADKVIAESAENRRY